MTASEPIRSAPGQYALPDLSRDWDEDGDEIDGTLSAGWSIAFGCRMNFGPALDGTLRVSVHVSDLAQREGIAVTPVNVQSLRALADYLRAVADEHDRVSSPVATA